LLVGEPSVVPWEFRGEAAPGAQDLGLAAKVGPGRALVAINADSLTAGLTAPVYRPHSLSSGSVRCPDPTWATALDHLRRVAAHEAVHLLRGDIVGATQHPPSFWDECQQLFGELGIGHVDCHRRGLAARERASGDWRTIW
jgi:hypothetical protein